MEHLTFDGNQAEYGQDIGGFPAFLTLSKSSIEDVASGQVNL